MSMEEIKKMANEFMDGELDKNKEPMFFSVLSEDYEGREYFKRLNLLKESVKDTVEEVPFELEKRILYSVSEIEKKPKTFLFTEKLFSTFSYVAAAVLLIISVFFFSQMNDYKSEIQSVNEELRLQRNTISVLMNSLPPIHVSSTLDNKVIVRSN